MSGTSRRGRRLRLVLLALLAVAVGASAGAGAARWVEPLPALSVHFTVPGPMSLGGATTPVPAPAIGAFAVTDSVSGSVRSVAADTVRPIASVAKTMTALAVLRSRPLAPGAEGPTYTVTAADVALLHQVIEADGSHANVIAGEVLTQRQLLLGLMLPSANNFAIMLGRWVAGSDGTFVAQLNAMATSMGMTHTHFVDADGLDPATVSTASDLVVMGQAAVADATLADIMAQTQATLPDGSVIHNLDTLVGSYPGWLGIKTGHTNAGGYCLLFAARVTLAPGTPPLTVVGAVLGLAQRQDTFDAARAAVETDAGNYIVVDVASHRPTAGGSVTSEWGTSADARLAAPTVASRVTRRGSVLVLTFAGLPTSASTRNGDHVGDVIAILDGVQVAAWPLVTVEDLAGPPWWWRLRR